MVFDEVIFFGWMGISLCRSYQKSLNPLAGGSFFTGAFKSIEVISWAFSSGLAIYSPDWSLLEKACAISLIEITNEMAPQITPKTKSMLCISRRLSVISALKVLLYMYTGKIKARDVHANDPIRLIKSPNLGTIMAPVAVSKTKIVRKNMRFVGRNESKVGIRL